MKIQVDWELYNYQEQQQLLQQLGNDLQKAAVIADKDSFVREVNEREKLASTIVASNLAIPHVRSANVFTPRIEVVKLPLPLQSWDGHQGIDRLIFALLPETISADDQRECEQFFARLGRQDVLSLFSCGSQQEIKDYLGEKR